MTNSQEIIRQIELLQKLFAKLLKSLESSFIVE